jgi:hypothetical protein
MAELANHKTENTLIKLQKESRELRRRLKREIAEIKAIYSDKLNNKVDFEIQKIKNNFESNHEFAEISDEIKAKTEAIARWAAEKTVIKPSESFKETLKWYEILTDAEISVSEKYTDEAGAISYAIEINIVPNNFRFLLELRSSGNSVQPSSRKEFVETNLRTIQYLDYVPLTDKNHPFNRKLRIEKNEMVYFFNDLLETL